MSTPRLRGVAGAHRAYKRLGDLLGVTPDVLSLAGIDPHTPAHEAGARLRKLVGPRAWRSAAARGSTLGASIVLMQAMRAGAGKPDDEPRKGRGVSTKRKSRRRVEDEDERDELEDEEPEPDEDEPPPSSKRARSKKNKRAKDKPSAARHGAQPTAAPRRSSKAHRDGITASDRELAARRGLDPAAVARSRRALFGGGDK